MAELIKALNIGGSEYNFNATQIGGNSFINTFNRLYKTSKSVTMTTTNTDWYVKITLSAYAQPNQLFVYCSYNNETDRATIDLSGMSYGYIFKNNCQNSGNIKGICFKSSYDSTEKKWIFWLKFDPIYTDYYSPSSSATCTVYLSDQNDSFDVSATTTDPGVNWITTGSDNNNIVLKNATLYGSLIGQADYASRLGNSNGYHTKATIDNALDTKLPVGGGTITGNLTVNGSIFGNYIRGKALYSDAGLDLCAYGMSTAGSRIFLTSNTLRPWGDDAELIDLGQSNIRWRTIYATEGNFKNSIKLNGTNVSLDGHGHDYLPLSGGTLTGSLTVNSNVSFNGHGSTISGHIYRNSYDDSGNVYDHYFTSGATYTNSQANLRVKSGNSYKVLTFSGDGSFKWNGTSVSLAGHTHTKSEITNFPTSLPANGGTADKLSDNSAFTLFGQTFFNNGKPVNVGSNSPATASYYNFRNNANTDSFGYIGRGGSSDLITFGTYGEQDINFMTNSKARMTIAGSGGVNVVGKLSLDSSLKLSYGSSALCVETPSGKSYFGAMNTGFCHIYTDLPSFYMDKSLSAQNLTSRGSVYTNQYVWFNSGSAAPYYHSTGISWHNNKDQWTSTLMSFGDGYTEFNSGVLGVGKGRFISYPNGGTLNSDNGSETGYIKITLPQSWTSTMMQFYVDIYNYSSGEMSTYIIGGYNYNGGATYGTHWVNTSAYSLGKGTRSNLPVQFGHDGSKCCVYIGNADTSWSYPHISVHSITLGHDNFDYSKWATGWNVGFTTTLGTISGTTYENPNMRSGLATSGHNHDSAYSAIGHTHTWANINTCIEASNEFNFVPSGYSQQYVWFNYAPKDSRTGLTTAISEYKMGNGKSTGGLAGVRASKFTLGSGNNTICTDIQSTDYQELVHKNDFGYISIGPFNNDYAHIYTDKNHFYFNKPILVKGTSVSLDGHTHNYAASDHTHSGLVSYRTGLTSNVDFNNYYDNGFWVITTGNGSGNSNVPYNYGYLLSFGQNNSALYYNGFQMSVSSDGYLKTRSHWNYKWGSWRTVSYDGHTHDYAASDHTHTSFASAVSFAAGLSSSANVTVTGKVSATQGFYEESDSRLKDFESDIIIDLDKIKQLPKKYFRWKEDPSELQIGTSAQAVQELYPELVSENENGNLTVAYDKLSVIALAAIDELTNKYNELEEKLNKILQTLNL